MRTRTYIRPVPLFWWLRRSTYLRYMLRELTCVPIIAYVLTLTVGLVQLDRGALSWDAFLGALGSPAGIALQVVVLVATVYHAVTWFALAPRTMPLELGGQRVPDKWILAAHYVIGVVIVGALLLLVEV